MLHHLRCNSALLHHSAVFCQVAGQHSDTAVCRERCLQGVNNLTVGVRRGVQSILYRAADSQAIGIDHTALGQLFHHCGNTAHIVQIRNKHGGGRIQLADLGGLSAVSVQPGQVNIMACRMGNGRQMQNGVGGAADGHICAHGVLNGFLRNNIRGLNVLFQQIHYPLTGLFRQAQTSAHYSRNGTGAGQGHADGLRQAVHGIGGIHTGAAAAGGAGGIGTALQNLVAHFAHCIGAHILKLLGQADTPAGDGALAGQHGAAADEDTGQVQSAGSQQHTGHDLVTIRDKHNGIQRVRGEHHLNAVSNQLTGAQRILHTLVIHGDTVANADGVKFKRHAAGVADTRLHLLGDLVQVHVAGNVVALGVHHGNERPLHLQIINTQCTQ